MTNDIFWWAYDDFFRILLKKKNNKENNEVIDINEWIWVFDNSLMVCRNVENGVIVKIERLGDTYIGILKDMSKAFIEKIYNEKQCEGIINQIVTDAEEAFFRAYQGK